MRIRVLLVVLLSALSFAVVPSASAATPSFTVAPRYPLWGSSVTVAGHGFSPNTTLTVRMYAHFHDPTAGPGVCAQQPNNMCRFYPSTDADGSFSRVIKLPEGLGATIVVDVQDHVLHQTISGGRLDLLERAMRLRLSDTTPARGSTDKVSIGGTYPGHQIKLYVDTPSNPVGTFTSSDTGACFVSYHVSRWGSGRHALVAYDPVNGQKNRVPFTIH
jgi:hypothetical protein